MLQLIKRKASGKNVILFFILSNAIHLIMLLFTIPRIHVYSHGMEMLDLMPLGYDADYVRDLFHQLGQQGRGMYLYYQLPLDLIYPFLYALSFALMFTWFLGKTVKPNSQWFQFAVIPLLAGTFDYLENFGIIAMLAIYPDFSDLLANITSVFSLLKSLLVSLSISGVLLVLIIFLVKKWVAFRQKK